jgi:hypothetical protein
MSERKGKQMDDSQHEYETWTAKDYRILSVAQCKNLYAVYAAKDETASGDTCRLVRYPLTAIAAAEVTERYMRRLKGTGKYAVGEEHSSPWSYTTMIGLELTSGMFEICEEACNFAGYANAETPLSKCIAFLDTNQFHVTETHDTGGPADVPT